MRTSLAATLLAGLFAACAPGRESSNPQPAVFEMVAGTWGWVEGTLTCETNPHTITFSPDGKHMLFQYPAPVDSATGRRDARYEIRGHGPNVIRAFLLHETRRDDRGALVEWDLVLITPDIYVWRRSDWPQDAGTKPIERCTPKPKPVAGAKA